MSWTLSSSGAAIWKAGKNASSTATASGAMLAKFSDQAEGQLCLLTRKDWVADYSEITANYKPILDDAVSDLIAMRIINYDMSGFTSRLEAGGMMDALYDNYTRCLAALKEKENQEVMD